MLALSATQNAPRRPRGPFASRSTPLLGHAARLVGARADIALARRIGAAAGPHVRPGRGLRRRHRRMMLLMMLRLSGERRGSQTGCDQNGECELGGLHERWL